MARKKESETETIVENKVLEIKDIEGVGPALATKLRDVNITTVMQLAVADAYQLSQDLGKDRDVVSAIIHAARDLLIENKVLDSQFMSGKDLLKKRQNILKCTTGSKALDTLLKGGLEAESITEFYGEFGSGKSQICFTMCVLAQQPVSEGGLGGGVIYFDTEGTFRPERIQEICNARGLDAEKTLENMAICKLDDASDLELQIKGLGETVEKYNAKLVIVDSIIALHRAGFPGRGTLADRQQRLNILIHTVLHVAEKYKIAVIFTNQVASSPDTFFGDPTKPTGGNIIGHAATYRVYLRKSGENRVAKMVDSPYHAYDEARFTVNAKGIDDVEEKKKRGFDE